MPAKQEPSDLLGVAGLYAQRTVFKPRYLADATEQFGLAGWKSSGYDAVHAAFYAVLPRPGKK
jgi:hypothetical protein